MSEVLAAALRYARAGLRVVALYGHDEGVCHCGREGCGAAGKHPRGAAWQERATWDEDEVARWWARWPGGNVGIATGHTRDGWELVVVDVDGPEGEASLAELEAARGALPETYTVRSGRDDGGRHLYFRAPEGTGARNRGRLRAGLDVRGEGGQVVAPPSIHPTGRPYTGQGGRIAAAPAWLLEEILRLNEPAREAAPVSASAARAWQGAGPHTYVEAALRRAEADVASTSTKRHTAVFREVAQLARYAPAYVSEQEVATRIKAAGLAAGLRDDRELAHQIENGLRVARAEGPAAVPELPTAPPPRASARPAQGGDPGEPDADDAASGEPAREGDAPPLSVALGRLTYHFGEVVKVVGENDDGEPAVKVLGYECWPQALLEDLDAGKEGVWYRCRSRAGRWVEAPLHAGAWTNPSAAKGAAVLAADGGAQVAPGQGAAWVMALGAWATARGAAQPSRSLTARSGWHREGERWVYVNEERVMGAPWAWCGQERPARARSGSLEGWRACVEESVWGPVMGLALAVSLAGALIEPLRRQSFGVHIKGDSSWGKSVAAALAWSVWGPHDRLAKWKDTVNATENALGRLYNGAVIVLDELGEAQGRDVAEMAYRLSDNIGKGRARRSENANREQARWGLTCVSTGEITIKAHCGEHYRDGIGVRLIDLEMQQGESTRDARNAQEVEAWVRVQHGHAGDAWARHLQGLGDEGWTRLGARAAQLATAPWSEQMRAASPQAGRVAAALSLAAVALEEAQAAGIVGPLEALRRWLTVWVGVDGQEVAPGGVGEALLWWALRRVEDTRGDERTPNERLAARLVESYHADPSAWPVEASYREGRGAARVIGVLAGSTDATVYVTAGTIKEIARACAVGERQWLEWARNQGLAKVPARATPDGRCRVGGALGRWVELDLHALQGGRS